MFKDLLVHIPTERSPRPAIDGSVSLAMRCGAHVEAVAAGYESTNFAYVTEGGAAVASTFEIEHARALERAKAALRIFKIEAENSGIAYDTHAVTGNFAEIVKAMGATARLYDLIVVSQGDPDHETFDNRLPKELLLQSGGPLLFLPYTFSGAFRPARIGICWDGSRLAARAVRDAMPFLSQADALTTITLNPSKVPTGASATQLARHLARVGLPVRDFSLRADQDKLQATLLSVAADEGVDLLVMGGYGHSRLQETVFGGVTRDMFRSMTVPVLMSH